MSYKVIEIKVTPEFWHDASPLPYILKDCDKKLDGYDGYLIGDDIYCDMEQYNIIVVKGQPEGFFTYARANEDKIVDRVKKIIEMNAHAKFVGQKAGWLNNDLMNNKITVKLDFEWVK